MKRYIWTFIFLLGACSSTTNIYTGSKIEDMPEEEQRYFRAIARQEDSKKNCPCPPQMTGGEVPFLAAEGSQESAPSGRKIEPDLSAAAPPVAERAAAEDFYVSSPPKGNAGRVPENADNHGDADSDSDFPFIDNNQESVSDSSGTTSGEPSGVFSGIPSLSDKQSLPAISSEASFQAEKGKDEDDSVFFSSTPSDDYVQVGTASWYGGDFDGKPTANGEIFDSRKLTAAHKKLPLGSVVLVRNLENNRELVLRVNDRGPYVKGRVLDVSEAGAEKLAFKEKGLTTVGIKILRRGEAEAKDKGTTYKFYRNYTNFEELEEDEPQENGVGGPDEVGEPPSSSTASSDVAARDFTPPDSYFFSSKDSADSRGKKKSNSQRKNYESSQNGKKPKEYMREEMVRGFSVQAGLFENEYNALELKYRLSSLNVPVYVLKRKNMFVVKAGNFGKRDDAEALRYRLLTLGFTTFIADPD